MAIQLNDIGSIIYYTCVTSLEFPMKISDNERLLLLRIYTIITIASAITRRIYYPDEENLFSWTTAII